MVPLPTNPKGAAKRAELAQRPPRLRVGNACLALVSGLVLFCATATARAHGPAPAVLDVLALRDGAPWLVRTNVGLAESACDPRYGYRTFAYLCPSLWTGNELARAVAMTDGRVAVLDLGELHLSSASRDTFARDETSAGWQVRDVAVDGETLWVLARDEARRSRIFRHGETMAWTLDVHPDDLDVVDGEVLAVASDPPTLCTLTSCSALPLASADRITLRGGDARSLWLLVTAETRTLGRLDRSTGAFEPGPEGELVLGPITHAERTIAVVDGAVWEHRDGWLATGTSRNDWTCLTRLEGQTFACSLDGLLAVDDALEGAPVFRLAQLAPPRDAHADECALDWAHFGGESRWVDTTPAGSPDGARGQDVPADPSCREPGGCAAAAPTSTGLTTTGLALVALWLRRARSRGRA